MSKTYIGGGLDDYRVAGPAENTKSAGHAAQYAVLITDAFRSKTCGVVALFMPAYDGIIIGCRRPEIAVCRMRGPLHDCPGYRGNCGKIHICNPHGNDAETVPDPGIGEKSPAVAGVRNVNCYGVFSQPVHNSGKIVFHKSVRLSVNFLNLL